MYVFVKDRASNTYIKQHVPVAASMGSSTAAAAYKWSPGMPLSEKIGTDTSVAEAMVVEEVPVVKDPEPNSLAAWLYNWVRSTDSSA